MRTLRTPLWMEGPPKPSQQCRSSGTVGRRGKSNAQTSGIVETRTDLGTSSAAVVGADGHAAVHDGVEVVVAL